MIDQRPKICVLRLIEEKGEDPYIGCEVPGCFRDAGWGSCISDENYRLRLGQQYLHNEKEELLDRIAHLEAHRDALHETANRYLERARGAEADLKGTEIVLELAVENREFYESLREVVGLD